MERGEEREGRGGEEGGFNFLNLPEIFLIFILIFALAHLERPWLCHWERDLRRGEGSWRGEGKWGEGDILLTSRFKLNGRP